MASAGGDVLEHDKPLLAAQFRTDWAELEAGAAYVPEAGHDLLVYDRDDERVRHQDADRIAALWPGAEVLKTSGHGHTRVLLAPDMWARVGRFLVR